MVNRCRLAYASAHGADAVDPPAWQLLVPCAFIASAFVLNTLGLVWNSAFARMSYADRASCTSATGSRSSHGLPC